MPPLQTACRWWDSNYLGIQTCFQCHEGLVSEKLLSHCCLQHHHCHRVRLVPDEFNKLHWTESCWYMLPHTTGAGCNKHRLSRWTSIVLDATLICHNLFQRWIFSEMNLSNKKACVFVCQVMVETYIWISAYWYGNVYISIAFDGKQGHELASWTLNVSYMKQTFPEARTDSGVQIIHTVNKSCFFFPATWVLVKHCNHC